MKRVLVCVAIVSAVVAVGWIAMAQAQRPAEPELRPVVPDELKSPARASLFESPPASQTVRQPAAEPAFAADPFAARQAPISTPGTSLAFAPASAPTAETDHAAVRLVSADSEPPADQASDGQAELAPNDDAPPRPLPGLTVPESLGVDPRSPYPTGEARRELPAIENTAPPSPLPSAADVADRLLPDAPPQPSTNPLSNPMRNGEPTLASPPAESPLTDRYASPPSYRTEVGGDDRYAPANRYAPETGETEPQAVAETAPPATFSAQPSYPPATIDADRAPVEMQATDDPRYQSSAPPAQRYDSFSSQPAYVNQPATAPATRGGPAAGGTSSLAGSSEGRGRPGSQKLAGAQSPALVVEKIAPDEVQVGKLTTVEIVVRNVGSVPALQVEVTDEIPAGARFAGATPQPQRGAAGELVWQLGTINPGDESLVSMQLTPVAEGELGSVARVRFAAEATSRTVVTRPELTLAVNAPREVLMGEDITFSIKLTNTGTGTATGVILSEVVPKQLEHTAGSDLEYEVGDLRPGESRELDLVMRAVQPGAVTNVLSAIGEGEARAQAQSMFQVVAPQLQVALDGPRRRYLERPATYTVSVSNPGTAAAHEVELVTYLPRGMEFVDANNAGQYDAQTHAVYWLLEELPPREMGEVTVVATPTEAGQQVLRVEGRAERGLKAEKEETVLVEGVAAILFQVADTADPIEVGEATEYEIRVVNQGSKEATNVQLLVNLPPEIQATGADAPVRWELAGSQVRFEPLGRLAPKAESVFRVSAKGLAPGDLRVRVQVVTDELRTPVTKEESTRVYAD